MQMDLPQAARTAWDSFAHRAVHDQPGLPDPRGQGGELTVPAPGVARAAGWAPVLAGVPVAAAAVAAAGVPAVVRAALALVQAAVTVAALVAAGLALVAGLVAALVAALPVLAGPASGVRA